jgi:hypothetical protein
MTVPWARSTPPPAATPTCTAGATQSTTPISPRCPKLTVEIDRTGPVATATFDIRLVGGTGR